MYEVGRNECCANVGKCYTESSSTRGRTGDRAGRTGRTRASSAFRARNVRRIARVFWRRLGARGRNCERARYRLPPPPASYDDLVSADERNSIPRPSDLPRSRRAQKGRTTTTTQVSRVWSVLPPCRFFARTVRTAVTARESIARFAENPRRFLEKDRPVRRTTRHVAAAETAAAVLGRGTDGRTGGAHGRRSIADRVKNPVARPGRRRPKVI